MKKLVISLAAIFALGFGQNVMAKTVPVTALTPFNNTNPPAEIAVKIGSNIQVKDDIVLFEGFTVKGKLVLQNGILAFVPYSFINIHNEEGQFEPQTYGTFAGYVNNSQVIPVAAGTAVNINPGQMFVLNFKDVIPKQTEMPQNVTDSASTIVINTMEPATVESQKPFSKGLPGLPVTDLGTMDATNRYNPAMPLVNILRNRNGEFLR